MAIKMLKVKKRTDTRKHTVVHKGNLLTEPHTHHTGLNRTAVGDCFMWHDDEALQSYCSVVAVLQHIMHARHIRPHIIAGCLVRATHIASE